MEMKTDSTADTVAASLRKLIAAGDLADGARLVERELASRLSVSKIHLREGLQKLKHEGLIEINSKRAIQHTERGSSRQCAGRIKRAYVLQARASRS